MDFGPESGVDSFLGQGKRAEILGAVSLSVRVYHDTRTDSSYTPGARQGFGRPNYPRHPIGGSGMTCDRALLGGDVAATERVATGV